MRKTMWVISKGIQGMSPIEVQATRVKYHYDDEDTYDVEASDVFFSREDCVAEIIHRAHKDIEQANRTIAKLINPAPAEGVQS